jgi:hypothetical protein
LFDVLLRDIATHDEDSDTWELKSTLVKDEATESSGAEVLNVLNIYFVFLIFLVWNSC